MRRCVHLLTHPIVANPLNQHIAWNSCAVLNCDAPPEKHHNILSRLTWLQTRGSYWTAWGSGRRSRRRWNRGLLRHCDWYQKRHCNRQQDENAHAVSHGSMPRAQASDAQNPRANVSSSQGSRIASEDNQFCGLSSGLSGTLLNDFWQFGNGRFRGATELHAT